MEYQSDNQSLSIKPHPPIVTKRAIKRLDPFRHPVKSYKKNLRKVHAKSGESHVHEHPTSHLPYTPARDINLRHLQPIATRCL